jgi:CAAX prenyl protease-like protein
MPGLSSAEKAYLAPFAAFLACLLLGQFIESLFEGMAAWPLATTRYWLYPLQTILCGALLWHYRRFYEWRRHGFLFAGVIGLAVFLIWIAPQFFHAAPRLDGFDPWFFSSSLNNAASLSLRLLRLVVIVPLLEEIFWRGFLLRWLIDQDFTRVPFGTFGWRAFIITTLGFCLEHQVVDWPAALAAGALYNWVAFRTRNLAACVFAHALTNLLLGLYVLRTGQWGFW